MPECALKPTYDPDTLIVSRLRTLLGSHPAVFERRTLGSLAFLVHGKLCICAGKGRLLCRTDPDDFPKFSKEPGVRAIVMRGKALPGYLEVDYESVRTKAGLAKWVKRCLAFNERVIEAEK